MAHQEGCGLCRIDIHGVSVRKGGDTLLEEVSTHLHCGEITALIGPNGAGKTTLIRALLRQTPYTGAIRHVDEQGRDFPGLRTGYVPQQLPFDKDMPVTVTDFIAASLTRRPVWLGVRKAMRERVRAVLSTANAERLSEKRLGALSGGELQRVLLAMALCPTPDLLVLDEPVSGIDQNGLSLFLDTVDALRAQHHMAILLVSHDWTIVRKYADRVVLLSGRVLCEGTPGEVFGSAAFAGAFPGSVGGGV